MAVTVQWLVQDRVILSTFSGFVSQAEIETWLEDQKQLVASGIPQVHHISDTLAMEKMEVRLKVFQLLFQAIPQNSDFGWHIEVTKNPITKMNSAIVSQFANVKMRAIPSLEETKDFLNRIDPTLRDLDWHN